MMDDLSKLLPRRPYLFKALYHWILDNQLTPYLVVKTDIAGVSVPEKFITDNHIVLNIAPHSINNYQNDDKVISFEATFSGVPNFITVPFEAVEAVYAKENGVGLSFDNEPYYENLKNKTERKSQIFKVIK